MRVRASRGDDVPALQRVLDETGLFPGEMLPDLIGPALNGDITDAVWLTAEVGGIAVGFCYAAPEQLTDGTWNMRAIAVLPSSQGRGVGAAIMRHLESDLRSRGQRVLIADTSGKPDFARTRAFYRRNGYSEEARIRDFWAQGDDKVVFWKSVQA